MANIPAVVEVPQEVEQSQHERAYAMICLVSLLLVVVLLMLDGMGMWSVLPMLVGGVAFLLRWRSGPPLVLFIFLWMAPTHFVKDRYEPVTFIYALAGGVEFSRRDNLDHTARLQDVVLCAALLTYTATCYRALALSHSVFPPERRRLRGRGRGAVKDRPVPPTTALLPRPAEPARSLELPILFGALAASALAAFLLWLGSSYLPALPNLGPVTVRSVASFWGCILAVSLCLAAFRYLGRLLGAPKEENLLYLQDQVWQQTRQEQSAINRWLAWARLRGQRRKER